MANDDLDNAPNTDQDINTTPPNHPDEYAIRYGGASNPDLDVAGDNDQTGASNITTGGEFDDTPTANADAGLPTMQPGGDGASTDIMSGNPGTGTSSGVDQVPQARTDTTLDEDYSTGPRSTDPEQELLNPGYDPQAGRNRNATGPNRAGDRVPPTLPGLPDQTGTLDQTTYSSESDSLGTNAGTGSGAGLP